MVDLDKEMWLQMFGKVGLGLDGDFMMVFGDLVKDLGSRLVLECFGLLWECFGVQESCKRCWKREEVRYI